MNIGARNSRPPVVVTGAFQTGVCLMRNLVRRGVEVCCVDCDPTQQGFRTVYGKAYLCPNPDTHPSEWESFMIDLARSIGEPPVLIASADQFVTAAADHASALEPHYIFSPASVRMQALLATKKAQYEIAEANGLIVPNTRYVQNVEEVREFGRQAQYPCLLKPVHFREWARFPEGHPLLNQKTTLAYDAVELEAKYHLAEGVTPALMVQEIIEGPDDAKLVYLSCYGRGSRRLGSCIVREIRTNPMHFGSASVVEPVDDPETDALCDSFFRRTGYEGICELELKRDTRNGRVQLIEANPRYSVTADAAPYGGVDLGWLHYLDLIGEDVEPATWNGRYFHHIVLLRDIYCLRSYFAEGVTTWGGLIKSYESPAFFDFDPYDWRLAFETAGYIAKALLHGTTKRLFRK